MASPQRTSLPTGGMPATLRMDDGWPVRAIDRPEGQRGSPPFVGGLADFIEKHAVIPEGRHEPLREADTTRLDTPARLRAFPCP